VKRLFLDLETSPNTILAWGVGKRSLMWDHDCILTERKIIIAAWKWSDQKTVHVLDWGDGQDDRAICEQVVPVLDSADQIIAHNGNRFDLPWIRTRCLKHGIRCNWNYKSLDTVAECRKRLYLNSNRLDYISKFMGREGKIHTDFLLWKRVVQGEKAALREMIRYCRKDVLELEAVYQQLAPYLATNTHDGVLAGGEKWQCQMCGSEDVKCSKTRTTAMGTVQRQMLCHDCGRYYTVSNKSYADMLEVKAGNCS
jgi:hypothetical protein